MKSKKRLLICSLLSLVIGAVIGICAGFFGRALHFAEEFREQHYLLIVPFLGVVGVFILFLYKKVSPNSEQGLNLAIAYNMGKADSEGKITSAGKQRLGKYPKAYAPLKLFTNITMLFFGASTGKEGSFAAFGASIGDYVSRMSYTRQYSRVLLMAGVSAAVSGLFQAPLGGVFFALEFTAAGIMAYSALIPILISAYTAYFFSKLCGYTAFYVPVAMNINYSVKYILLFVLCAVVFSVVGRLFAVVLFKSHNLYNKKVKNRYLGIFIAGTIMAVVLIFVHGGRYCGTGGSIISGIFSSGEFKMYDFALKFIFTIICITVGFSGGEMMPLLTIGASLGAALSALLGLPLQLTAAAGAIAVYASATNTLVAPIFLGVEMFGTDAVLIFALCCAVAYAFNDNVSVYTMQSHALPHMYRRMKNSAKNKLQKK